MGLLRQSENDEESSRGIQGKAGKARKKPREFKEKQE